MVQSMKNVLTLRTPASWWGGRWREALPSGNGEIGAAVYGSVNEETVLLTHEDLWWQGKTPEMPDVSDLLPEVRRLMLGGTPQEAERILVNAFKERGYAPSLACPLPLGDLKILMPGKVAFKQYRRTLNMETGEVAVNWLSGDTRFERVLFVSRTDDMVVCEIRKSGPEAIDAWISLDLHHRSDVKRPIKQPTSPLPEGEETAVEGEYITYAAKNDDGTDFGAVARVMVRGGEWEESKKGIQIRGAESVLIGIKLFIKGNRAEDWSRLKEQLVGIEADYAALLSPHAEEHGRIFNATVFDIGAEGHDQSNEELLLAAYDGEAPAALVEKMWSYGRYLLIASSREGGHPCHLTGLWSGEYRGFWAFNMTNENLQMIYWQALSGNMPELLLAVFDYFDRLMDDFRENARKIYGCRGIFVPGPIATDSGLLKTLAPHIVHWTGGAGWIAQHYYDYYLHTGNVEFLRNRALPFLRETALFYKDFFIQGEDGYFISCPSNSPENFPGNHERLDTTINATMDFAIAKEVLNHLVEGSRIAGVYEEEVAEWEAMLEGIPAYQINEDGAIREWMHPDYEDNYHHRHQSHIYPVFPGTEVTRDNNPELFEAFVTAVRKRNVVGLGQQTGWSLAHMANNYARMGEGNLALECLDLISRSCIMNNFYTLHNDWRSMGIGLDMEWAPYQIDANMGWSAAVQEMLVYSVPGHIQVLPALPERWEKGIAGPLLARGGIEVSIQWDRIAGSIEVELMAPHGDQEVRLSLPEGGGFSNGPQNGITVSLEQGKKRRLQWTRE